MLQASIGQVARARVPGGPPYFSISARKFALLLFGTGGLYFLAWLYNNWWAVRLRSGQKLSPMWRTHLFIIFLYPLLQGMRVSADVLSVKTRFSPLAISLALPLGLWLGGLDELLLPVGLLSLLPLVFVQRVVNQVNARLVPTLVVETRYRVWERVVVFGCDPLVLLALLGIYLGP